MRNQTHNRWNLFCVSLLFLIQIFCFAQVRPFEPPEIPIFPNINVIDLNLEAKTEITPDYNINNLATSIRNPDLPQFTLSPFYKIIANS